MQLTLTLHSEQAHLQIPVNYNHMIQAALYRNLTPEFADFLHSKGYVIQNRRFALFAFSRLLGKSEYDLKTKTLCFETPVRLAVASPIDQFIQETAELLLKDGLRLGENLLRVTSVEMNAPSVTSSEILVETLSPIVAYSTLFRPDGRKYTLYYNPGQSDFNRILTENLMRKGKLIYGSDVFFEWVQIKPAGSTKKHIVTYKNTIIEGYSGRFVLQGDQNLLQTALEAGVGSKNSAGFGMIQLVSS